MTCIVLSVQQFAGLMVARIQLTLCMLFKNETGSKELRIFMILVHRFPVPKLFGNWNERLSVSRPRRDSTRFDLFELL
jgi:hypothetical protein